MVGRASTLAACGDTVGMSGVERSLPRLRQAVLVASEIDPVSATLRDALDLGEPFSDPGVDLFGLQNRVFAIGDTFLEIVSPVREGTAAGRWLSRRGGDCGYMVMFEVRDLAAARRRAAERHIREVFEVEFEDITEVHLHPADMRGAIVALSTPRPHGSWRWGGPGWRERSRPLQLAGVRIAVEQPEHVSSRWSEVLGVQVDAAGVQFGHDETEPGIVEITLAGLDGPREPLETCGVRFAFV
jgi:hypothetical protein